MLSVKRKADREKMAAELEKLITESGAHFVRREPAPVFPGERCIMLSLTFKGLNVSIDIDGKDIHDGGFLLSWHMNGGGFPWLGDGRGTQPGRKLAASFSSGNVNTHHWHKATDYANDFEDLKALLVNRLRKVADGSAFQPMSDLDRAWEHLHPVVSVHDEPMGENWKPEICPRYAAHTADSAVMYAATFIKGKVVPRAYYEALATFGNRRAGLFC